MHWRRLGALRSDFLKITSSGLWSDWTVTMSRPNVLVKYLTRVDYRETFFLDLRIAVIVHETRKRYGVHFVLTSRRGLLRSSRIVS